MRCLFVLDLYRLFLFFILSLGREAHRSAKRGVNSLKTSIFFDNGPLEINSWMYLYIEGLREVSVTTTWQKVGGEWQRGKDRLEVQL